jgi:TonB-dependent SusC/RagA subfamily outer membrane receptor
METVYIYILKSIFVSGILLGYYWLALRNTRFHHYNRFYLLATILLALVLPAIDLNWFTLQEPEDLSAKQLLLFIDQPGSIALSEAAFTWEKLLFVSIVLVSFSLVAFFSFGIYKIYRIRAASKLTPMDHFNFIETGNEDAPFSFFRNLFWRKDMSIEDETGRQILRHELTHIEQLHTYDKLLIAMLSALFWMNPFLWIIRRELEVIHEFIADEKAVDEADASALAAMLLQTHYQSTVFSTGQSFFYSSIKRRIIMLTSSKKVSYSYARRLLILPVAMGILVLLSFTIKESLSDHPNSQMDKAAIAVNELDTVPAKYRDPKTGQIEGSFQIDIDGEMASFKDIKSKKELFKVPLNELAGPANKKASIEGSPLYTEKKIVFISGDSIPAGTTFSGTIDAIRLRGGTDGSNAPRIIINGREISPADLDKFDPSSIKTIDIRGAEKGVAVSENKLSGMTWTEATSADGKKIVTVKVDSVMFDGKAKVAVPVHGKVSNIHISVDTSDAITVTGYKANSNVSTTIVRTSDDKVVEKAKTDPNAPITVTGYKTNSKVATPTQGNVSNLNEKGDSKASGLTSTLKTSDKFIMEKALQGDNVTSVNIVEEGGKKVYYIQKKVTASSNLPAGTLFVVDGKVISEDEMKAISPDKIQSINVLKGPSAEAKYGDKGKNGVVEITSKKN